MASILQIEDCYYSITIVVKLCVRIFIKSQMGRDILTNCAIIFKT